jgi:myotubularin-related protein 9
MKIRQNSIYLSLETSILVHGNDGWDNTLLVTSLAQILLDPNCRTITGYDKFPFL